MITQTMISFKVDTDQLERFDVLCKECGLKRNKMLNFMVKFCNDSFADVLKYMSIIALREGLKALNED